jgi:2-amino-4-hydroxy-6-hydroxymethyldihydropteridine diphosphokinase
MDMAEHQVCLLLGSNIEPEKNIPNAVFLLRGQLTVIKVSSIWESASVECCYPEYLNIAVLASTPLAAMELNVKLLRPLEARMGRVRTQDKNASRPIDIDIILFDGEVLDPTLWQHVHRALPVSEIFPELISDRGERLADVARALADSTPIHQRTDILFKSN